MQKLLDVSCLTFLGCMLKLELYNAYVGITQSKATLRHALLQPVGRVGYVASFIELAPVAAGSTPNKFAAGKCGLISSSCRLEQ